MINENDHWMLYKQNALILPYVLPVYKEGQIISEWFANFLCSL